VKPGPEADRALLAHMLDCLTRINEYTGRERRQFASAALLEGHQEAAFRAWESRAHSPLQRT